jgi:hypothetical protein
MTPIYLCNNGKVNVVVSGRRSIEVEGQGTVQSIGDGFVAGGKEYSAWKGQGLDGKGKAVVDGKVVEFDRMAAGYSEGDNLTEMFDRR